MAKHLPNRRRRIVGATQAAVRSYAGLSAWGHDTKTPHATVRKHAADFIRRVRKGPAASELKANVRKNRAGYVNLVRHARKQGYKVV